MRSGMILTCLMVFSLPYLACGGGGSNGSDGDGSSGSGGCEDLVVGDASIDSPSTVMGAVLTELRYQDLEVSKMSAGDAGASKQSMEITVEDLTFRVEFEKQADEGTTRVTIFSSCDPIPDSLVEAVEGGLRWLNPEES